MNVDRAIRRAERIPRLESLARRHSLFSENLIEITPRRLLFRGGFDQLGLALRFQNVLPGNQAAGLVSGREISTPLGKLVDQVGKIPLIPIAVSFRDVRELLDLLL